MGDHPMSTLAKATMPITEELVIQSFLLNAMYIKTLAPSRNVSITFGVRPSLKYSRIETTVLKEHLLALEHTKAAGIPTFLRLLAQRHL